MSKSKGPSERHQPGRYAENRAMREFRQRMAEEGERLRGTPPENPKDWPNRSPGMTEAEFLKNRKR